MRWTSEESCIEFHKLSKEYKIVEIGVRSKKLWSKHGEADLCVAPVKLMPSPVIPMLKIWSNEMDFSRIL